MPPSTEGGDNEPIRSIRISKRPFIFDNSDLYNEESGFIRMDSAGLYQPFSEEDKIEKEIPMISITSNDISRQDIELVEPASKRIDWSKGPNYNNQVRSSLRPPYYPEKVAEGTMNMKPLRRNYDYRRNPTYDTPNYPTSGKFLTMSMEFD